jgi:hypothetical protein
VIGPSISMEEMIVAKVLMSSSTHNMKKVTIMGLSGSKNKLTQNMYIVRNVRSSDTKVNKTPYNMTITSRILKRLTINGCKVNIELQMSLSNLMNSKRSSIKKILNILFLRQKEPLRRGRDLNSKNVPERTKIKHKKLITKMSLNKGNVLRVIDSDDHIIHINKDKSPTTRRRMNEGIPIMSTSKKTSSCDHRGKALKSSPRSLLTAIK